MATPKAEARKPFAAGLRCPTCGLMQLPGPACKSCGASLAGPSLPRGESQHRGTEAAGVEYARIGGWLILPAAGLVVSPLRGLFSLFKDLFPVFSRETWSALTTPGTEAYHPLWAPLLIFELITSVGFILFAVLAAVAFFRRRRIAPKLLMAFLLSNLVVVAADHFAANLIPAVASQGDPTSARELARVGIACVIWVPYLLRSKRVRGTFVH